MHQTERERKGSYQLMKGASDDIVGKEMFSASDANAIGGVSNLRRLKVHRLSLGNRGKKKKN